MKKNLFVFVTIAIMSTSCATLVNGTKQTVTFNSEPIGAEVTLSQKGKATNVGKTPLTVEIPRKTKTATFVFPGYYEEKVDMRASADIHWLYFVDCFAGLAPAVVDLITGGYIIHEPTVKVELKKK
jgi:hypothetical protein